MPDLTRNERIFFLLNQAFGQEYGQEFPPELKEIFKDKAKAMGIDISKMEKLAFDMFEANAGLAAGIYSRPVTDAGKATKLQDALVAIRNGANIEPKNLEILTYSSKVSSDVSIGFTDEQLEKLSEKDFKALMESIKKYANVAQSLEQFNNKNHPIVIGDSKVVTPVVPQASDKTAQTQR